MYHNRTIADSHLNRTQVLDTEKHEDVKTGGAAQMKMQGLTLYLVGDSDTTSTLLLQNELPEELSPSFSISPDQWPRSHSEPQGKPVQGHTAHQHSPQGEAYRIPPSIISYHCKFIWHICHKFVVSPLQRRVKNPGCPQVTQVMKEIRGK